MSRKIENILKRELKQWEKAVVKEADLFLVGGVVRDLLRGKSDSPMDLDYIARGIGIDRLISILKKYGKTKGIQ
jgi:tRNA nucleotidyltransferase/poly(A) polymerase